MRVRFGGFNMPITRTAAGFSYGLEMGMLWAVFETAQSGPGFLAFSLAARVAEDELAKLENESGGQ